MLDMRQLKHISFAREAMTQARGLQGFYITKRGWIGNSRGGSGAMALCAIRACGRGLARLHSLRRARNDFSLPNASKMLTYNGYEKALVLWAKKRVVSECFMNIV